LPSSTLLLSSILFGSTKSLVSDEVIVKTRWDIEAKS
jgi:hypothetical protein